MKFTENEALSLMWDMAMPGPGMRMFYAYAGDWQFVIAYDQLHGHWGASYQPKHPQGKVSSIPCEPGPDGTSCKFYDSQTLAEIACVRKYRELHKAN